MDYGNFRVESTEALAPGSSRLGTRSEGIAILDAGYIGNGPWRFPADENGSRPLGDAEGMTRCEPAQRAEGVEEVVFELLGSCNDDIVDVPIFDPKTGRP